jgi:hypothetical protein
MKANEPSPAESQPKKNLTTKATKSTKLKIIYSQILRALRELRGEKVFRGMAPVKDWIRKHNREFSKLRIHRRRRYRRNFYGLRRPQRERQDYHRQSAFDAG